MRIEQVLSMVKTRVVILSLVVAWALSFLTQPQTVWLDWMGFILMFWAVYQPARITFVLAFGLGLLMDVQQTSVFGQHALMYVWLVYTIRASAKILQYSSILMHALAAVGIMFAAQMLRAFCYLLFTGQTVALLPMVWILLGAVGWLLLAWLIARGTQFDSVGSWLAN